MVMEKEKRNLIETIYLGKLFSLWRSFISEVSLMTLETSKK